jgi:hypothetical protein
MNLEKVLDITDLVEADDEYYLERVLGSLDKTGKVTYFVQWRGFLAKKDWTRENYDSFYSL